MIGLIEDNPQEALRTLLRLLNAKFTDYSIRNLRQHPDYPSLLAINHTLNQLQIDNIAVRGTYEQLQNEFPKPLLVHTQYYGGTYLVIGALDEERVHFVNPKGNLEAQPKAEFLKAWSGIAVLVDEESKGVEQNYSINKVKTLLHKAKLPVAAFGLLLLIGHVFYYTNNFSSGFDYLFLLTKSLGVVVTIPLMIRLIDKENSFVRKLCNTKRSAGRVNCASILDTPAANFLGVFAWSEIGFLYFTILFFYLLLFQAHSNAIIAGIAIAAAPYTIYSFYYQWKVARQWCRLCLAVQAVLLLDLLLAVAFFSTSAITITYQSILTLVLVSFIGSAAYSFLKPVIVEWKSKKNQFLEINKIKLNSEVFQLLLKKNPAIDISHITPIRFGNPEGIHTITIVTNPLCRPCIEMHRKLFEILNTKNNVLVNKILLTEKDEQHNAYKIAHFMLKLYYTTGADATEKALTEYYDQYSNNFDQWKQKHDQKELDTVDVESSKVLEQHINWCSERNISSTPIIFYNHCKIPDGYTVEDLDYLID